MILSGEVAFILITLASLGSVLLCANFGEYWLHASVVILLAITTFTAGKLVTVLGLHASIATPIYAGIFLATDAIHENFGKKSATVAVFKGFFAMMLIVMLGQLILAVPSLSDDQFSHGLSEVLEFVPGLFIGSSLAYLVSQNLDIRIYGYIKDKFPDRLWLRNNISTIISQAVDTIIVYTIAFYAIPSLYEVIIVAWFMKIIVAIADTPFMYMIKQYHLREVAVAKDTR